MKKTNKQRYIDLLNEQVRISRQDAIRDWRSFPSSHPIYLIGAESAGRMASYAIHHFKKQRENPNVSIFGVHKKG